MSPASTHHFQINSPSSPHHWLVRLVGWLLVGWGLVGGWWWVVGGVCDGWLVARGKREEGGHPVAGLRPA
eukprot:12320564-Karenia_brevis.AAC.1